MTRARSSPPLRTTCGGPCRARVFPLPRTLPFLLAASFALLPLAEGAVVLPTPITGEAPVSDYYVHSTGTSKGIENGIHQRHLVCTECYLNLTITGDGLVYYVGGQETRMGAGVWHVWEFTGSLAYDHVSRDVTVFHLDGEGIVRYAGPA